ncbi:MAG: ABC transporter permease, partial [Desulfosalsimonas sp.]
FFNAFVVKLENVFEARYFIAIGGMLLGNSLRGNIIGLTSFYHRLKRNENRYLYTLSAGASLSEAILPYLRKSVSQALSPIIATMATIFGFRYSDFGFISRFGFRIYPTFRISDLSSVSCFGLNTKKGSL